MGFESIRSKIVYISRVWRTSRVIGRTREVVKDPLLVERKGEKGR